MAHRYGKRPSEMVPGVTPGSWTAAMVDLGVYQAGEDARVAAAKKEGAMIFPTWSL